MNALSIPVSDAPAGTRPISAAVAASAPTLARQRPVWPWALWTLAGLTYMVWAGSSYDPRKMGLWWINRDGWISPAPGLGHLVASWVVAFAALTMVNWRARENEFKGTPIWGAVVIGFIVIMALDVRLVVFRGWLPLVLDPQVIAARAYLAPVTGRGLAIVADMVTLALLCLALRARGRNPWLAALFAFHPLAIIESAANGSRISWLLPLVALVAMGWRLHKWLRELVLIAAAAACTWWLAHVALTVARPFDGFCSAVFAAFGLDGRPGAAALILLEGLLQMLVVLLALRRRWSLARALTGILVAWALVSPTVTPGVLLPLTALAVLDGSRAGWILSGTVLLIYLMLGLHTRGDPWVMPTWLTFLVTTPVLVVAAEEWIMDRARPT